jgi:hypothetical protein
MHNGLQNGGIGYGLPTNTMGCAVAAFSLFPNSSYLTHNKGERKKWWAEPC